MTKALILALALALGAYPAHAATDTFLPATGKCSKASNWSLGVVPTPFDAYVPAGSTMSDAGGCAARSLYLEGRIVGAGGMTVGNSLRAEGPAGRDTLVKITGEFDDLTALTLASTYEGAPQVLDLGSHEVRSLRVRGTAHYELGEDATHFGTEWWMAEGSYFDTGGYNVGGMGWTLVGLPATLKMHGSEWDTGEWRVASSTVLEASDSTIYEDDGSYGILEGHGQVLGRVVVENHRPHVIESFTASKGLELRKPSDGTPVVFAGLFLPNERPEGTITLPSLATDGTEADPVVTEGKVTFVIPHDVTVTGGCLDLNEVTVVGGTLYDPCGEGVEDSGVVFGP